MTRRSKVRALTSSVRAGDIVLIHQDMKKRISWPLARILELIPGKDGVIRVIRLKTTDGELTRPLQRLIFLEDSIKNVEEGQIQTRSDEEFSTKNDKNKGNREIVKKNKQVKRMSKNKNNHSKKSPSVHIEEVKVTRSGRKVRLPKRF